MLVRRYKCDRQLLGSWSLDKIPCFNEFWGPECSGPIEEMACPFCGKKGTLVMYKREWQVEPDIVFASNRKTNVNLIEKPQKLLANIG